MSSRSLRDIARNERRSVLMVGKLCQSIGRIVTGAKCPTNFSLSWVELLSTTRQTEVCRTLCVLPRRYRRLRLVIHAAEFAHPAIVQRAFHDFIAEQREHSSSHKERPGV